MPTVAIIGASRGIGLGFAEAYAADGWTVHATTRTPDAPGALGRLKGANGGSVTLHELDVLEDDHIAAMATALDGVALDVLIHNAGVQDGPRDLVMAVNADAPFRVIDALMPALLSGDTKKLAILTSQMGAKHGGRAPSDAYGASKAALNDRFRAIESHWRADGVTAVVFHPGWVRTDMGGRGAPVSVADSVAGMRKVLAGLTPADSGKFLTWQGRELSW
ncbi:MAG: SDR family NAD(P)-dependent oxidoreductase [Alphaproteobacteria bacterium]|jgi:NAD(P)-dependent dehydrogenase (short-subunit alcohol dehydrogenase family)